MAEVHVPARFAEQVAATIGRRLAAAAARAAAEGAQRRAPDAKVWVTAHDERVRREHVRADQQTIPANVRYRVLRPDTGDDANDVRTGYEEATGPRDPNLSIGNRINCRCGSVPLPGVVAAGIHAGEVVVTGTRATVEVTCRFPAAPESERASGGGFMAGGLEDAVQLLRDADTRR